MTDAFLLSFDDSWRVERVGVQPPQFRVVEAGDDDAPAVRAAMHDLGYRGGAVGLALPSRMVYAARISAADLPRSHRRNTMLCLLEEQLPLDIERITVGFLPQAGEQLLGVAVESAPVKALADRLQAAGIEVQAICPAALLALWQTVAQSHADDYVVIAWADGADVFRIKQGVPAAWYTIAADPRDVLQCIQADQLDDPVEADQVGVCLVGAHDWASESLELRTGIKVTRRVDEPAPAAAGLAAAAWLGGQQEAGWVNLRTDALAMSNPWAPLRTHVRLTVGATLLLLAVLAGTFLWRGLAYQQAADLAYEQEAAAYVKANPGRRVPDALNRRLRGEVARLKGLSGAGDELPQRPNALETLRRLVTAFPASVRLKISQLRVGPADVYLEAQTRSHADAEAVYRCLVAAGLAMDPPRSENLAGAGVSFTLAGKPAAPAPPHPPAAATEPASEDEPDPATPTEPNQP